MYYMYIQCTCTLCTCMPTCTYTVYMYVYMYYAILYSQYVEYMYNCTKRIEYFCYKMLGNYCQDLS